VPSLRASPRRGIRFARVFPLVAACAGGVCRDAGAQAGHPAVAPGERVRVEAPTLSPGRTTWDVSGIRRDTLLLLPAGAARGPRTAVALADVTRLEVNRGARRNTLIGGAVGLVLGATAGAVYGADRPGPFSGISGLGCLFGCTEEQLREVRRAQRPAPGFYAVLGAAAGLPVGTLVGRFVVGDRWERVGPGRTPARLGIGPAAGGAVRAAVTVPLR
jgi:hypothetical protein